MIINKKLSGLQSPGGKASLSFSSGFAASWIAMNKCPNK
jgi:hypothetical protein